MGSTFKQSYDPMLLPEVVLDNILEFVDDGSLLTSRLVCHRWRREITTRNSMWRRRCRRADVHEDRIAVIPPTPSEISIFKRYVNTGNVSCWLAVEGSWQVDETCDGSGCTLHRHFAATFDPERPRCEVSDLVHDASSLDFVNGRFITRVKNGELMVIDVRNMKVLWKTGSHITSAKGWHHNGVFAVTRSGNIEVYSWTGACKRVIDTDGRLKNVKCLFIDFKKARFMVVLLDNNDAFLVNDEMQIFPVDIPPPPPEESDQENGESSDTKDLRDFFFWPYAELGEDRRALVVEWTSSSSFAIINEKGEILDHVSVSCSDLFSRPVPCRPAHRWFKQVGVHEGDVTEHVVHFEEGGIRVEQLWRKPLPAILASLPQSVIVAGKKFILVKVLTSLLLYRLDDGAQVVHFPGFFVSTGDNLEIDVHQNQIPGGYTDSLRKALYNDIWHLDDDNDRHYATEDRPQVLHVINADWLDGLSPETMRPDIPVAVLFSRHNKLGKCLRFSGGLWENRPPPRYNSKRSTCRTVVEMLLVFAGALFLFFLLRSFVYHLL